jgi:hypothetical protein
MIKSQKEKHFLRDDRDFHDIIINKRFVII